MKYCVHNFTQRDEKSVRTFVTYVKHYATPFWFSIHLDGVPKESKSACKVLVETVVGVCFFSLETLSLFSKILPFS